MAASTLTIGEFSRMTHLSAKTLRFYHRVGLLEPAEVNAANGYREYSLEQLPTAQVIRRFRALGMPIDSIREVLGASSIDRRNLLIAEHLDRMESQLAETRSAVASLQNLLTRPELPFTVEHRSVPATPVLMISDTIDLDRLGEWWPDAFHRLDRAVLTSGHEVTGPRGGLYSTELFLNERGEISVFRPIALPPDRLPPADDVVVAILPAVELAVATHVGPDGDVDRSYAALGRYVTSHELSVDGPIRESYPVSEFDSEDEDPEVRVTEIGWPIFRTAG